MKEVAELVFLQPSDIFGDDAIGRQIAHLEARRIEVLPVVDRDTARVEELEIRAKGTPRVRDRLVARGP